ncbi:tyrosine-type recombinase/integrase [Sulfuriroseicoccus oceanibius]|uniref:Tyrosine-type recombinase/integrase n=1 Tax=Sulfuriroseicoccus oceanibius TaxID=2707525 RepID=A0A6B3L6N5_9BACT|nr:tyrosine-type recombinase/integrase [Sulfuriroseicoccus oceanibius]QQL44844.1 tyrosine-type recombinase/integrase [Sulfuriroseicoccus oceanibius]
MAGLKKRGNIWYARWTGADGKRITRTTGESSKTEARKKAIELEALDRKATDGDGMKRAFVGILKRGLFAADAGKLTLPVLESLLAEAYAVANPDDNQVTLREHWEAWHDAQAKRWNGGTISASNGNRFRMLAALGDKVADAHIGKLTEAHISAALDKMLDDGKKRGSINQSLSELRRVMTDAHARGICSRNPAKLVKSLPMTDKSIKGAFTRDEIERILALADDEMRGIVLFATYTGLRLADVIALHSDMIDGEGVLIVTPKKTRRFGKTVAIPLAAPVKAWVADKAGELFPEAGSKKPEQTSRNFNSLMKQAGVPREITLPNRATAKRTFHSLRVTFVSWLAAGGVAAEGRMQLAGHSSEAIHQLYNRTELEQLKQAIATLEI